MKTKILHSVIRLGLMGYMLMAILFSQDLAWVNSIGGPGVTGVVETIENDPFGNIYCIGSFHGTIDLDPGAGTDIRPYNGGDNDIFIIKLDSNGGYIWGNVLGTSGDEYCYDILIDSLGNFFLITQFDRDVDMDPGAGVHIVHLSNKSMLLSGFSNSGNHLWTKAFENCVGFPRAIEAKVGGGFILSGIVMSYDTFDIDPDTGVVAVSGIGWYDPVLASFSPSFSIEWFKHFVGTSPATGEEYPSQAILGAQIMADGSILCSGWLDGVLDADPDTGTIEISSARPDGGSSSALLILLDSTGNYKKHVLYGDSMGCSVFTLKTDLNNNIYLAGYFDQIDFDPGPGTDILYSDSMFNDLIIARLDTNFSKIWAGKIHHSPRVFGEVPQIQLDNSGDIIILGGFNDSIDVDPDITEHWLISRFDAGFSQFLVRLDSGGTLISGLKTSDERMVLPGMYLSASEIDEQGNIFYGGGYSDTTWWYGDSSVSVLVATTWASPMIVKYYASGCLGWTMLIDSILNITCTQPGYASVITSGDSGNFRISWNTTPTTISNNLSVTKPGVYSASIYDTISGCQKSRSAYIDGPTLGGFDLSIVTPWMVFSGPGDTFNIDIYARNLGCDSVCATVFLRLDSNTHYISSIPTISGIHGDSLLWYIPCAVWPDTSYRISITLSVDSTALWGENIFLKSGCLPVTGDINPSNNIKTGTIPLGNSYDPNDKTAFTSRTDGIGLADPNTTIQYLVRFQNTGTAEAIRIGIVDTLDTHLDPRTFKVLGSSHPMQVIALDSNVVKFWFPAIHLPDSNANEPGSHGWIVYQIEQRPDLPYGTEIENTAYIYFDYNPAVITNTTVTTIAPPYVGMQEDLHQTHRLLLYPNPASTVLHVLGLSNGTIVEALAIAPDGRQFPLRVLNNGINPGLSLEGLESGYYALRLQTGDGQLSWGKFVVSTP